MRRIVMVIGLGILLVGCASASSRELPHLTPSGDIVVDRGDREGGALSGFGDRLMSHLESSETGMDFTFRTIGHRFEDDWARFTGAFR